jgi:F-type H+-transporting ATPase subunit c
MNSLRRFLAPAAILLAASPAFAQTAVVGAANPHYGWYAMGAAIAIGLAALGGALAQGRTAAAALEGIARNPSASDKIFTPFILGLALIESLVLLAWLIAGGILGPIGK